MNTPYTEVLERYQNELLDRIMSSLGIPAALLQGTNYSSSRVSLETFERRLGVHTEVGGTWLGEVQSP